MYLSPLIAPPTRVQDMLHIDPFHLRQILLDETTPGMLFMLIWSDLDENSDAYRALSEVLFDHAAVNNPDDAPTRDLSDPSLKRNVADCAARFPEVHAAAERVINEIRSSG